MHTSYDAVGCFKNVEYALSIPIISSFNLFEENESICEKNSYFLDFNSFTGLPNQVAPAVVRLLPGHIPSSIHIEDGASLLSQARLEIPEFPSEGQL